MAKFKDECGLINSILSSHQSEGEHVDGHIVSKKAVKPVPTHCLICFTDGFFVLF